MAALTKHHARDDPEPHSGLSQQLLIENNSRVVNICLATPGEGHNQGCTVSVSLFSMAITMIIKSAEVEGKGPRIAFRVFGVAAVD